MRLTPDDTVELFNLVMGTNLSAAETRDLVFVRALRAAAPPLRPPAPGGAGSSTRLPERGGRGLVPAPATDQVRTTQRGS